MASKPYPNVNVWVGPNGDYASVKAAIEGEATNLTGLGPFVIGVGEPINEPNAAAVSFTGWTTTASDYLHIWVAPWCRHQGYWNPSKHFSVERNGAAENWTGVSSGIDYIRFEGVAMCTRNTTPGDRSQINTKAATTGEGNSLHEVIDSLFCCERGPNTVTALDFNTSVGSDVTVRNSIFIGVDRPYYSTQAYSGSPRVRWHNCTFRDTPDGLRLGDVMELKNCLFDRSPIDYTWGGSEPYGSANSTNCVSDSGSILQLNGSNHVVSDSYFMDEYEFDGRLSPGCSEHLRVGANLRNDVNLPVNYDVVGTNRDDGKPGVYVGAHHPVERGFRGFPVNTSTMKRVYRGRR